MPEQKLRWVLRQRKNKPMFILQQLISVYRPISGGGHGWSDPEWVDVPVVDDGLSDSPVQQASWITTKIKEFWKARVSAKESK